MPHYHRYGLRVGRGVGEGRGWWGFYSKFSQR